MAHLAIVGSHSTNGVAAHPLPAAAGDRADGLRRAVPRAVQQQDQRGHPAALAAPGQPRPRRRCSPRRSATAGSPTWRGSGSVVPLADDAAFREKFRAAKRAAKARFADWLRSATGEAVDPDTLFDVQVKRIHEYKRQLLNVLHVLVLYNRLRDDPGLDVPPRTVFFAGKAAPAYHLAKLIIHLINNVGRGDRRRPGRPRAAQGRCSCPSTTSPSPSG